jgi:two-component system, oxyanion-binding sensor
VSLDTVSCGFIPLTDCAVLVAAQEMGFAAEMGIDLDLKREASWSNIRDKIAFGIYPMAHMLSPMVLASSLGVGPVATRIDAPFVLSVNGEIMATTRVIAERVHAKGGHFSDPLSVATALLQIFDDRPLRIGVPFPHSMHRLLTSYLFRNLPRGREIEFVTAPPPILEEVLRAGEIDAFIVGEPWSSIAVEEGDAEILLPGAAIWVASPDKVLGVRRDWIDENMDLLGRLLTALSRAADWANLEASSGTLAEILSQPKYLDKPSVIIERAISGQVVLNGAGELGSHQYLLRLGGDSVNFPWRSAGEWIASRIAPDLGVTESEARSVARSCFRPDLFRSLVDPERHVSPPASSKVEGTLSSPLVVENGAGKVVIGPDIFFDGETFDPGD